MIRHLSLPAIILQLLIHNLGVFRVVVVWIRIKYFVVFLVEYLELHEVQALLDQVHVSKVLQV